MNKPNEEKEEEWILIPIPGNDIYEASNLAQIRNKITKLILKKYIRTDGYEIIGLWTQKKQKMHLVHRLVALAFILNPNNFPQVNHKDRNKVNNRVENLEWVTRSMNMKHCVETGRNRYKRAVRQRDLEGNEVAVFDSLKEAAEGVKCSVESISNCVNGRTNTAAGFIWEHIKNIKEEAREDIASMEIKGYSKYLIYNNGQIYSENVKRYLNSRKSGGYYRVTLSNNNISQTYNVHILVAQYFCENPDNKPIVNHKDGNKLNNHYTNLEWVTHSENSRHAHNLGLINKPVSKRIHQYAREDKDKLVILRTFNSRREAAEFVKRKNIKSAISTIMKGISAVCTGKRNTTYGYRWGYEKEIVL
jgi:hypothetical protein